MSQCSHPAPNRCWVMSKDQHSCRVRAKTSHEINGKAGRGFLLPHLHCSVLSPQPQGTQKGRSAQNGSAAPPHLALCTSPQTHQELSQGGELHQDVKHSWACFPAMSQNINKPGLPAAISTPSTSAPACTAVLTLQGLWGHVGHPGRDMGHPGDVGHPKRDVGHPGRDMGHPGSVWNTQEMCDIKGVLWNTQ